MTHALIHFEVTGETHCRDRFACVLLITGLVGAALLRAAAAKEFLGIHLGPTPSEFPTRSFRDDTAAAIAGAS